MATSELTRIVQELQDKDAIQRLLIDYAVALDLRDWVAMAAIFTDDMRGDYGGVEVFEGRDKLIAMMRAYMGACGPTQHLLGNYRIEIDGDRASSRCYVRAMHIGTGAKSEAVLDLWGEYIDELVRTGTGWRIAARVERAFHMLGDMGVLGPEADQD